MKELIRNEIVMVKKWVREDGKIFLHTQNGHKYRYVGKYDLNELDKRAPKDTGLYIKLVFHKKRWILFDNGIIWC